MQPFIDAEPIEPGTCPAPDDQLVTVIPATIDPWDQLEERIGRYNAESGLTFDEYRSLVCAETLEGRTAIIERMESQALVRKLVNIGRRIA